MAMQPPRPGHGDQQETAPDGGQPGPEGPSLPETIDSHLRPKCPGHQILDIESGDRAGHNRKKRDEGRRGTAEEPKAQPEKNRPQTQIAPDQASRMKET